MELSKKGKEACEILSEIEVLVKKFKALYGDDDIDKKEGALIGGLVIGVFSPAGGIGFTCRVGTRLILAGLQQDVGRSMESAGRRSTTLEELLSEGLGR